MNRLVQQKKKPLTIGEIARGFDLIIIVIYSLPLSSSKHYILNATLLSYVKYTLAKQ